MNKMGIFKRLKTITKAELNGLLDGLEEPIAMLNEYSREMEQEIAKGQQALARQIFVEKKQAALILDTQALVDKRTRQAKLAIEKGDDAMTKLAIQEKLIHEKQLKLYQEQYETLKGQTQSLTEKLNVLRGKYHELQHKKIILASRANVAQCTKQIQKATVSFQTDTIARGVARAEERILMMEAEVQAGNSFAPAGHEAAIKNLVDDEELMLEIEKLKTAKETL
jgi:phage shock protein A